MICFDIKALPDFLSSITQRWRSTTHKKCVFNFFLILWHRLFNFIFANITCKSCPIGCDRFVNRVENIDIFVFSICIKMFLHKNIIFCSVGEKQIKSWSFIFFLILTTVLDYLVKWSNTCSSCDHVEILVFSLCDVVPEFKDKYSKSEIWVLLFPK